MSGKKLPYGEVFSTKAKGVIKALEAAEHNPQDAEALIALGEAGLREIPGIGDVTAKKIIVMAQDRIELDKAGLEVVEGSAPEGEGTEAPVEETVAEETATEEPEAGAEAAPAAEDKAGEEASEVTETATEEPSVEAPPADEAAEAGETEVPTEEPEGEGEITKAAPAAEKEAAEAAEEAPAEEPAEEAAEEPVPLTATAPSSICPVRHVMTLPKEFMDGLTKRDKAAISQLQAVVNVTHSATGTGCPVCAKLIGQKDPWPVTAEEAQALIEAKAKAAETKKETKSAPPKKAEAAKDTATGAASDKKEQKAGAAESAKEAKEETPPPATEDESGDEEVFSKGKFPYDHYGTIMHLLPPDSKNRMTPVPGSKIRVRWSTFVQGYANFGEKYSPQMGYVDREELVKSGEWQGVSCVDCDEVFDDEDAKRAYIQYGMYRCPKDQEVWKEQSREKVMVPTADGGERLVPRFWERIYRGVNRFRKMANLPIVPVETASAEWERILKERGLKIPELGDKIDGEPIFEDEHDRDQAIKSAYIWLIKKGNKSFQFLPKSKRPKGTPREDMDFSDLGFEAPPTPAQRKTPAKAGDGEAKKSQKEQQPAAQPQAPAAPTPTATEQVAETIAPTPAPVPQPEPQTAPTPPVSAGTGALPPLPQAGTQPQPVAPQAAPPVTPLVTQQPQFQPGQLVIPQVGVTTLEQDTAWLEAVAKGMI